jgi:hypothetical protein
MLAIGSPFRDEPKHGHQVLEAGQVAVGVEESEKMENSAGPF